MVPDRYHLNCEGIRYAIVTNGYRDAIQVYGSSRSDVLGEVEPAREAEFALNRTTRYVNVYNRRRVRIRYECR